MERITVERVHDGDTIAARTVADASTLLHIRLKGIDAPELAQRYGREARDALATLLAENADALTLARQGIDRYGRTLGTLYGRDELDLNLEMVRRGYAWHYAQYYASDAYAAAQTEARAARLGLWHDDDADGGGANPPIAPWVWRRERRHNAAQRHRLRCELCGQTAEYRHSETRLPFCGIVCASLHYDVSPRQVYKRSSISKKSAM